VRVTGVVAQQDRLDAFGIDLRAQDSAGVKPVE
jgi:hypothetical protein